MRNLVVVGMQWGDEGKGKVVDFLAEHFDVVARFQGGSNAGHTVIDGNRIFKFRIMPTGAVRGKKVVIGNGVVLDPFVLEEEIQSLESAGITIDLLISERAHIITPYHIQIDSLQEKMKSDMKVGTTKRGIGPTYSDKVSRIGIRVCDILSNESSQWEQLSEASKLRIGNLYSSQIDIPVTEIFNRLRDVLLKLRDYVGDTGEFLLGAIHTGKRILFEGAQGALLDIDHGTYPYVTSSNCVSSAAATGSGISFKHLDAVLGIAKAYTTRVGQGPFPTEIQDTMAEHLLKTGKEYGTITGRARRCGWLDLVALRYAARINGTEFLALTKADVLCDIDPVQVCVAYELDGEELCSIPANTSVLDSVNPVYEEMPGWHSIQSDEYENLPGTLREYISTIEKLVDSKVVIVSVGPDRNDTIIVPGSHSDMLELNDNNRDD